MGTLRSSKTSLRNKYTKSYHSSQRMRQSPRKLSTRSSRRNSTNAKTSRTRINWPRSLRSTTTRKIESCSSEIFYSTVRNTTWWLPTCAGSPPSSTSPSRTLLKWSMRTYFMTTKRWGKIQAQPLSSLTRKTETGNTCANSPSSSSSIQKGSSPVCIT